MKNKNINEIELNILNNRSKKTPFYYITTILYYIFKIILELFYIIICFICSIIEAVCWILTLRTATKTLYRSGKRRKRRF